jgi:DNA-binding SARP family transcriptional activator
MNNLNQTLYFLRRDIDRWYEEGVSVDYVRFEGDLLWLDDELVSVASHAFDRAARTATAGTTAAGLAAFEMYDGRFAPEHAYDDWSSGWREQLHARYLSLAQGLIVRLAHADMLADAHGVAAAALTCDPDALDIERDLIWLYGRMGYRAAAIEQYRHYAAAARDQLGVEPPQLAEVLRTEPGRDS